MQTTFFYYHSCISDWHYFKIRLDNHCWANAKLSPNRAIDEHHETARVTTGVSYESSYETLQQEMYVGIKFLLFHSNDEST